MTKNEPVAHLTEPGEHLSLLYHYTLNEIRFASAGPDSFFGIPLHSSDIPVFLNKFEKNEIARHWQSVSALQENETKRFTIPAKDNPRQHFSFEISRPPSDLLSDNNLYVVSVIKWEPNDTPSKNAYLEFLDLASHDMDSPMRKVLLFSERLFNKVGDDADPDIKNYLTRMSSSIGDLRSIVGNLSLLSKLSAEPVTIGSCDLSVLVKKVAEKNPTYAGNEQLFASIAKLPAVEGDCTQYKTLFEHLWDNAVKFRKENVPPEIEINYEILPADEKKERRLPAEKTFHRITISDHGIGFKNEMADKIFVPFVRLNGKSEYPGNGIGLALCKKIVENHRGIIYAEGNDEIGASFTLILPQSPH